MARQARTVKTLPPAQGTWPRGTEFTDADKRRDAIERELRTLLPRERLGRYVERGPRGAVMQFPIRSSDMTGDAGRARHARYAITTNELGPRLTHALIDAACACFIGAWADIIMQGIVEEPGNRTLLDASLLPKRQPDARSIRGLRRIGYTNPRWIDAFEYVLSDVFRPADARSLLAAFTRALRTIIERLPEGVVVACSTMKHAALRITRDPETGAYTAELTTL